MSGLVTESPLADGQGTVDLGNELGLLSTRVKAVSRGLLDPSSALPLTLPWLFFEAIAPEAPEGLYTGQFPSSLMTTGFACKRGGRSANEICQEI
jgi:hypothetical protein